MDVYMQYIYIPLSIRYSIFGHNNISRFRLKIICANQSPFPVSCHFLVSSFFKLQRAAHLKQSQVTYSHLTALSSLWIQEKIYWELFILWIGLSPPKQDGSNKIPYQSNLIIIFLWHFLGNVHIIICKIIRNVFHDFCPKCVHICTHIHMIWNWKHYRQDLILV